MRSAFLPTVCVAFENVFLARAGRPQYSVGFDFSLDYAVASIYFPNRTFVDVATVQGGVGYRQVMRKFMSTVANEAKVFPVPQSSRGFIQQQLPAWLQPAVGRFCSHLPPSWSGGPYVDDIARAFAPMLHTLKTATKSYLGVVDCLHIIFSTIHIATTPQLSPRGCFITITLPPRAQPVPSIRWGSRGRWLWSGRKMPQLSNGLLRQ